MSLSYNVTLDDWIGYCKLLVVVSLLLALCRIGFPNAYSLMNHWQDYIDTVMKSRSGIAVDLADYGILGSTGLAAGAFLLSPWAEENVPDIQLTVFPSV